MSEEAKRVRTRRAEGELRAPEASATAPLTRRAMREKAAERTVAEPTTHTTEANVAEVAEPLVSPAAEFSDQAGAATVEPENQDAFAQAARLFAFTGEVPIKPEPLTQSAAPAAAFEGPRVARSNFRKIATAGFSVGVVGVIGALVASMSMPFLNPATASASVSADLTPVSAKASLDDEQIQAFVASSDVQNPAVDRSTTYSGVSVAQIAEESGIRYSNSVFTNDPNAKIQWPFAVGVGMSYGYGMRDGRLHEGIDFVPGEGAPIQAIADGVVRIATENGGAYGVTVYIDHEIDGQTITSHYAHMQYGSIAVKEGQHVKVGDLVGKTGNTGRSFGAHLHFEIIVNGSTIDPLPWLKEHAG